MNVLDHEFMGHFDINEFESICECLGEFYQTVGRIIVRQEKDHFNEKQIFIFYFN